MMGNPSDRPIAKSSERFARPVEPPARRGAGSRAIGAKGGIRAGRAELSQ